MNARARMLLSLIGFCAITAFAGTSRADDCGTQLAPLFNAKGAHIKMTIATSDPGRWVSYTDGFLKLSGAYLTAEVTQLFSDRVVYPPNSFIGQPFNINNADQVTPYIGSTGMVWIYNNTWGGWVSFQGSCTGSFLYGFVNDVMVSFSLAPWTPPAPPR